MYIYLTHSEEIKDKYTAIIQQRINIEDSYKTLSQILKDFHGMVLASLSVSQIWRLTSDFKACSVRNLKLSDPFSSSQEFNKWAFSVKLPMF